MLQLSMAEFSRNAFDNVKAARAGENDRQDGIEMVTTNNSFLAVFASHSVEMEYLFFVLLSTFVLFFISYYESLYGRRMKEAFTLACKKKIFSHILHLDLKLHESLKRHRISQESEDLVSLVLELSQRMITLSFEIILALWYLSTRFNLYLAITAFVFVPIQEMIRYSRSHRARKAQQLMSYHFQSSQRILHEAIKGIIPLKLARMEKSILESYEASERNILESCESVAKVERVNVFLISELPNSFFNAVNVLFGLSLVRSGDIGVGSVLSTTAIAMKVRDAIQGGFNMNREFQSLLLSTRHLLQVLKETTEEDVSSPSASLIPNPSEDNSAHHQISSAPSIEFKNVTFGYRPGVPVIKNMSFRIDGRTSAAFVGTSGSGKSTIFRLICRLYDVWEGSIEIDGVDIKSLPPGALRGLITFFQQELFVFEGTVKENVTMKLKAHENRQIGLEEIMQRKNRKITRDALRKEREDEIARSDPRLVEACKIAQIHDHIITNMRDDYDTRLFQNDSPLSTGQLQRLVIARAIYQQSAIYLLDEPTSSLDAQTECDFLREVSTQMHNKSTRVFIAHRLSTILSVDQVIFLQFGSVVESGRPADLLGNTQGFFHKYFAMQQNNVSLL